MPTKRPAARFATALGLATVLVGTPAAAQPQSDPSQGAPTAREGSAEDAISRPLRRDDFDRRGADRDPWVERGRDGELSRRSRREGFDGGWPPARPFRPETGGMGPVRMLLGACGPGSEGMSAHLLDRLERITRPSEAQRAAFDKLKEAAGAAVDIARAGCPAEQPVTPPGRLAAAEKRLEALLQAVKTVRPAMDEFYGSLSEEQKARLYLAAPHRPGLAERWSERPRDGYEERRPERHRGGSYDDRRPDRWTDERVDRWRYRDPDERQGDRRWRRGGRDYDGDRGPEDDREGWRDPWGGRL
jgi:LTXXQ motif family protein